MLQHLIKILGILGLLTFPVWAQDGSGGVAFDNYKKTDGIVVVVTGEASAIDGGDPTITWSVEPKTGDMLLVCGSNSDGAGTMAVGTGFTIIFDEIEGGDRNECAYKFMGATPDTTTQCTNPSANTHSTVCIGYILRGVDPVTPLALAPDWITGATAACQFGSATNTAETKTYRELLVCFGQDNVTDTSITAPSGYGNQVDINADDTNDTTAGLATLFTGARQSDIANAAWTGFTTQATYMMIFRANEGGEVSRPTATFLEHDETETDCGDVSPGCSFTVNIGKPDLDRVICASAYGDNRDIDAIIVNSVTLTQLIQDETKNIWCGPVPTGDGNVTVTVDMDGDAPSTILQTWSFHGVDFEGTAGVAFDSTSNGISSGTGDLLILRPQRSVTFCVLAYITDGSVATVTWAGGVVEGADENVSIGGGDSIGMSTAALAYNSSTTGITADTTMQATLSTGVSDGRGVCAVLGQTDNEGDPLAGSGSDP